MVVDQTPDSSLVIFRSVALSQLPLSVTSVAFGADSRNVTERSGWISGDFNGAGRAAALWGGARGRRLSRGQRDHRRSDDERGSSGELHSHVDSIRNRGYKPDGFCIGWVAVGPCVDLHPDCLGVDLRAHILSIQVESIAGRALRAPAGWCGPRHHAKYGRPSVTGEDATMPHARARSTNRLVHVSPPTTGMRALLTEPSTRPVDERLATLTDNWNYRSSPGSPRRLASVRPWGRSTADDCDWQTTPDGTSGLTPTVFPGPRATATTSSGATAEVIVVWAKRNIVASSAHDDRLALLAGDNRGRA